MKTHVALLWLHVFFFCKNLVYIPAENIVITLRGGDDMQNIYSTATTSASHIFGNVAKAVESHIERKLPYGLIKDKTISTRMAPRFFKRFKNTNDDWQKKLYPFLIIRPSFETPVADSFLQNTLYTRNEGTEINQYMGGIQTFMEDKKRGFMLGFKINRYTITFDIGIQFETQTQMIDVWHYLLNSMRWDIPEFVNTSLESIIPKNIMCNVGEIIGVDITKDENIPTMLKYLRTYSTYPITYKMRTATSQDEYFLYYKQHLLTTFSDLVMDEGQKKGMTDEYFTLSFKCTVEFNVMGSYLLIGKKGIYKQIKFEIDTADGTSIGTNSLTPIFTYDIHAEDAILTKQGYRPLGADMIKTDEDRHGKDDCISLLSTLTPEIIMVLDNIVAQGLDPSILLKFKLFISEDRVVSEADYEVNWTKRLFIIKKSDKYATYRLVIYINLAYLNNRLLELDYHDSTDQQTMSHKSINGYDAM